MQKLKAQQTNSQLDRDLREIADVLENAAQHEGKYLFIRDGKIAFDDLQVQNGSDETSYLWDAVAKRTVVEAVDYDQSVSKIGDYAFAGCSSLTTALFPAASSIGDYAFSGCTSLSRVYFPNVSSVGVGAFISCKIKEVDFKELTEINDRAFNGCTNLISMYLTGSYVCTLAASTAFTSTPIGGYSDVAGQFGSIYVPASLISNYKAARNWSYFSSRFVAYEE